MTAQICVQISVVSGVAILQVTCEILLTFMEAFSGHHEEMQLCSK